MMAPPFHCPDCPSDYGCSNEGNCVRVSKERHRKARQVLKPDERLPLADEYRERRRNEAASSAAARRYLGHLRGDRT